MNAELRIDEKNLFVGDYSIRRYGLHGWETHNYSGPMARQDGRIFVEVAKARDESEADVMVWFLGGGGRYFKGPVANRNIARLSRQIVLNSGVSVYEDVTGATGDRRINNV